MHRCLQRDAVRKRDGEFCFSCSPFRSSDHCGEQVGLFSIFTGYDNANGTADPAVRSSDEMNSIHLGFSRDVRSSHPRLFAQLP